MFTLLFILLYFATIIALFIYHRKSTAKLKKQILPTKSNTFLRTILELTVTGGTLSESTKKIIEAIKSYYNIDYCTVYLFNEKLYTVASNVDRKHWGDNENYVNLLLNNMKAYVAKINCSDSCLSYAAAQNRNIKYSYFIPLLSNNKIIGAIFIENIISQGFNESEIEKEFFNIIIENIVTVLLTLIYKDEMHGMAMKDGLTRIYNRRYMYSYINSKIQSNKPFSIAMFDIDFFKKFNDTYGHAFGDLVLIEVSAFMKKHIRGVDEVFRIGGEEFILFFDDTTNTDVFNRLETIREMLSQLTLKDENGITASVTSSFGLAEFPSNGDNIDALLECADKALYYSKEQGRNRITVYEDIKTLNHEKPA